MPKSEKKRWTVMVYFAADNNLDSNAMQSLWQMWKFISAAQEENIHLVAQIDRRAPDIPTKRYHFTGGDKKDLEAYVVGPPLGETNSGSAQDLIDFVAWVKKFYLPADHYMLVLWGHGDGIDNVDECAASQPLVDNFSIARKPAPQLGNFSKLREQLGDADVSDVLTTISEAFSFGGDSNPTPRAGAVATAATPPPMDFLNNHELQIALDEIQKILGQKIDVLGFDACLMSMAEVYCQARGSVNVAVGSEETEPSDSWPYFSILKKLNEGADASPQDVASMIVTEYVESYKAVRPSVSTTQSACDLTKIGDLIVAVGKLGRTLKQKLGDGRLRQSIFKARRHAQAYYIKDYVDLFDLCEKLQQECDDDSVRKDAGEVMDVIEARGFVVRTAASANLEATSHGVSIYFPSISSCYADLDFTRSTRWAEFLFEYTGKALGQT